MVKVGRQACDNPHLEPETQTQAPVRAAHRYLSGRRDQLDYAGARARGLPIGSGEIESGHRHVIQQRLNPAPTDPVQEKIFLWMPVLFTFILASFPAGLVIYWTVNNILSILQQMVIMKREGAPISFRMFGTGQAT
jgi:hypothetical protein